MPKSRKRAAKPKPKKKKPTPTAADAALRDFTARWDRIAITGTDTDGGEGDLERGPEEERTIAGERVLLLHDKMFGGRTVTVVRLSKSADRPGDRHWMLGRVSDHGTRAIAMAPILAEATGVDLPVTTLGVIPEGTWRNDRNGWVKDQLTAETEDALIEQMVRVFLEQQAARVTPVEPDDPYDAPYAVLLVSAPFVTRPFTPNPSKVLHAPEFLDCAEASARLGFPVAAMWAQAHGHGSGQRPGVSENQHAAVRSILAEFREMFVDRAPARTDAALIAWARGQLQHIRTLVDAAAAALDTEDFSKDIPVANAELADAVTTYADQIFDFHLRDRDPEEEG